MPITKSDDLSDVPSAAVRMAKPQGDHRKVVEHDQWRHAVRGYLASIAYADAQIGRLLDALDKSRYAKNTVIVFWADHGWHLGEKEHWRKFALWERATRTPMAIVAPGVTEAGGRCEQPVSLIDLYPTLIDLCGLSKKDDLDGVSLVPLLKDPKAWWRHLALTTHGRLNHALRSDRYRYIRYADGTEELYDLARDGHEWNNLADNPSFDTIKFKLGRRFPKNNAPDAPRR